MGLLGAVVDSTKKIIDWFLGYSSHRVFQQRFTSICETDGRPVREQFTLVLQLKQNKQGLTKSITCF